MAPSSALPSAAASTLRPARAAQRYRKGQAPAGYAQQEEDDDDDEEDDGDGDEVEEADVSTQSAASKRRQQAAAAAAAAALKQQQAARRDGLQIISQGSAQPAPVTQQARQIKVEVKTDPDALLAAAKLKQEEESSSGEEESSEEEAAPPRPAYRPPGADAAPLAGRPAAVKQEEEETSSGEEESSSEEEEAARPAPLYKPMFVSKRVRDLTAPAKDHAVGSVGVVLDEEAAEMKRQAELEERRRQSTFLASESIKRELAGKETEDRLGLSKTDDTDGADPEGEFEAWKLRELMRIKREKEAGAARSAEREALEARRALPEALRLKEDTEHAAATRAAKAANRGQQGFLQKYHHKGAFFADDEILQRYDYTAPTEGETIRDVSSLPKVMQVRNYGKMGRTKYTHLADQDTSDRNAGWGAKPGQLGAGGRQGANSLGQGCFNCGGNHRKAECPELANAGPSGANASSLAPRQRRRSRSQSPRSNGRSYDDRRTTGDSSSSYRPSDPARDSGRGRDGDRDRSSAQEDSYDRRNGRDDYTRRDERRGEGYRRRSRSRSRSPRGGWDRDDKRRRRD